MLIYAEKLKRDISDCYTDRKNANTKPLSKDDESPYGGYMSNGVNSEGSISLGRFEELLSGLLGHEYTYDDYKRFGKTTLDDNNIIFPILDVLYKAARKLGTDDIMVDAVILNGGMSRLYLIKDRLAEFFHLKPITFNNPDTSVARGTAVYHHYLHKDGKAHQLHLQFLEEQERLGAGTACALQTKAESSINIQSIAGVLNEALYLGVRGGAVYLLVDSGQDLPYKSPVLSGFSIEPGQKQLNILIKQKQEVPNRDYRTIACGNINFQKAHDDKTPVAIKVTLGKNGILNFHAWTYSDRDGEKVLEEGSATLDFNTSAIDDKPVKGGKKILPPAGTKLVVANELFSFKTRIDDLKREKNQNKKNAILKVLKQLKKSISSCGNPEEFADLSLKMLQDNGGAYMYVNFLPVALQLSRYWTEDQRKALSGICLSALKLGLNWANTYRSKLKKLKDHANVEAIKTIGVCGNSEDIKRLQELKQKLKVDSNYRNALLYAFSRSGLESDWVVSEIQRNFGEKNPLQDSLQSTVFLFSGNDLIVSRQNAQKLGCTIMDNIVEDRTLTSNELLLAALALGEISAHLSDHESPTALRAKQILSEIPNKCDENAVPYSTKILAVAEKLVEGTPLSDEDKHDIEDYLLLYEI